MSFAAINARHRLWLNQTEGIAHLRLAQTNRNGLATLASFATGGDGDNEDEEVEVISSPAQESSPSSPNSPLPLD
ncbi:MAG TPA: hypothetical protein DDW76_35675 [Cyanobacteria bacterium UBA11369]|nr:hypothetical protein [Cyanobacteria bacterium UBA11371]HBE36956.1 hypothetical protein [Cyanobacteria bacterium UBA11368]HBE53950.1 hypothetical protein [Cyanobacteria bacterium UBA11369]